MGTGKRLFLMLLLLVPGAITARAADVRDEPAYEIKRVDGTWQAPNRHQGFHTLFVGDGIRLEPRDENEASWEFNLTL